MRLIQKSLVIWCNPSSNIQQKCSWCGLVTYKWRCITFRLKDVWKRFKSWLNTHLSAFKSSVCGLTPFSCLIFRFAMVDKNIYIIQGEIAIVVGAIKRNSRWSTHTPLVKWLCVYMFNSFMLIRLKGRFENVIFTGTCKLSKEWHICAQTIGENDARWDSGMHNLIVF